MNSENPVPENIESPPEPPRYPHLTILQAVGLVILLSVLQFLVIKVFSFARIDLLEDSHWFGLSLTHAISGLITANAGAILAGLSLIAMLTRPRFQFLLLLPLAVASCGITILASELGNLLNWLQPIPKEYLEFIDELYNQNVWGVLFTIGIVAPVVEELLFRGVILDGLEIRYNRRTAVVLSSILFGVTHILPHAVVNATLLGFFFAWLKFKTRSLRLCILVHAFYNSVPLLLTEFTRIQIPGFNTTPADVVQFQPWWFDMIGVVFLLLGIGGVRALYEPEPEEEPLPGL